MSQNEKDGIEWHTFMCYNAIIKKEVRKKRLASFLFGKIAPVQQKGGISISRRPKISSVKAMRELWEEYKEYCDKQEVLAHEFSAKNSEFVSKILEKSITYTIEGFCVYIGMSRQAFYQNYAHNEKYVDMVTRMREECELDARKKFELGIIPPQLAGLWMSRHGYTTKTETDISGLEAEKTKLDNLLEQLRGGEDEQSKPDTVAKV